MGKLIFIGLGKQHKLHYFNFFKIIFQIRQLDETANRLMQTHPDTAEQTYSKQREINEEWTQLTVKANSRKEKLLDSYDLQRFLADYRDLMSWISSMMGLVSSDELANDVTGAEALLERHQVYMTTCSFPHVFQVYIILPRHKIHIIREQSIYYIMVCSFSPNPLSSPPQYFFCEKEVSPGLTYIDWYQRLISKKNIYFLNTQTSITLEKALLFMNLLEFFLVFCC